MHKELFKKKRSYNHHASQNMGEKKKSKFFLKKSRKNLEEEKIAISLQRSFRETPS